MGHQSKKAENAADNRNPRKGSALYRKGQNSSANEFVLIVMWVHLFPSRTQKLSTCAPTILGGRLPGKIGNANTKPPTKVGGLFLPASVHRTLADGKTILGLPGKIGNANTKPPTKVGGLFLPASVHRTLADGKDNTWPTRENR